MRHLTRMVAAVLALCALSAPALAQAKLSGSGSTFIKPIMDKWIVEYTKEQGGEINYQGQGSGAGVKQMIDKSVDFGCTDAFMKPDQLSAAAKAGGDVVHVPLAMGAIAIAYNLKTVDKPLNLTGEVLAEIFLGNITNWNDAQIATLNPGINLPNKQIAVVHRADASGSTSIFTEYLSKHNETWKNKVRSGTTVNWPTGVGENQTAGVAGAITKSEGSIGYIELFYALQNKIPFAALKNLEGNFIAPSLESVSAAGAALVAENKVRAHLRYSLVDAPGKESYPLSGTTWAVLYVNQDAVQATQLKGFLTWVLHGGQGFAKSMNYAPLPEGLVKMAQGKVDAIQAR
jgi:phosphate ABC transporter phosphate-binding protein